MTKPNFFIVGAPKAGTTAMVEYLRTHPEIFMSRYKEPAFFSTDVGPSDFPDVESYLTLFADASPSQRIIGEASTFYLFSDVALLRIREFCPGARIMVMLRRPADLVPSYHAEQLKQGEETEWNLERAWSLQRARQEGRKIPRGGNGRHLNYRWIGSLGSQCQRVLEFFSRDQVHFVIFDDFKSNPRQEYLKVLEFLGLQDDGRADFPVVNENIKYRYKTVAAVSRRLRAHLMPAALVAKRIFSIEDIGFISFVDKFNAFRGPREAPDPAFARHLEEVFEDEVKVLEQLLGRDLTAWRSGGR